MTTTTQFQAQSHPSQNDAFPQQQIEPIQHQSQHLHPREQLSNTGPDANAGSSTLNLDSLIKAAFESAVKPQNQNLQHSSTLIEVRSPSPVPHYSPITSPGPLALSPASTNESTSTIVPERLKSPSLSPNFAYLANSSIAEYDNFGFLSEDNSGNPRIQQRSRSRSNSNENSARTSIISSPAKLQQVLNNPSIIPNPQDPHELVFNLFDKKTCGILSIKDGPTENPWRSIIWPLAMKNEVLFNAIAAMTKFHNNQDRQVAMNHMKESFNLLAVGLSNKTIPLDIALATTLVLALAEAWDRHISTGVAHIRGASVMLKKLLPSYRKDRKLPSWLQFLFNSWLYLDVVSRLTTDSVEENSLIELSDEEEASEARTPTRGSGIVELTSFFDSDESSPSSEFAHPSINPQPTLKKKKHTLKSFLFLGQGEEIDPLMGCAQTLFPLIGRVATLVHTLRPLPKNTISIVSSAGELKQELESWSPTLSQQMTKVEDPSWDLNSCLATAEAYRYAALLYLHQAVPELPSLSSRELAEKVLMLLAGIPATSRTIVVHIFPLLISGCEALPGEERQWVGSRWEALDRRMHIGNINCAVEVVREVWRRKDILRQRSLSKNSSDYHSSSAVDDGPGRDLGPSNSTGNNGGWGTVHSGPRRSSIDIAQQISEKVSRAFGGRGGELDVEDGIKGWSHWSVVMKEWGWEVLLG